MFNATVIDDLAKRLSDLVPPGAREAHDEMLGNFRDALRAGLRRQGRVGVELHIHGSPCRWRVKDVIKLLQCNKVKLPA